VYCHCLCHQKLQDGRPLANHITACCHTCMKCGRHVHFSYVKKHQEECGLPASSDTPLELLAEELLD